MSGWRIMTKVSLLSPTPVNTPPQRLRRSTLNAAPEEPQPFRDKDGPFEKAFAAFSGDLDATLAEDGTEAAQEVLDALYTLAEADPEDAKEALEGKLLTAFANVAMHMGEGVETLKEALREAATRKLREQAAMYEAKLATVRTAADVQIGNQKLELEAKQKAELESQILALSSGDGTLLLEARAQVEDLTARLEGLAAAGRASEELLRASQKQVVQLESRMAGMNRVHEELAAATQSLNETLAELGIVKDDNKTLGEKVAELVMHVDRAQEVKAALEAEVRKHERAAAEAEAATAFEREMHLEEAEARRASAAVIEGLELDRVVMGISMVAMEAEADAAVASLREEVRSREEALREIRSLQGRDDSASKLLELREALEAVNTDKAQLEQRLSARVVELTRAYEKASHDARVQEGQNRTLAEQMTNLGIEYEALKSETTQSKRLLERTFADLRLTKGENKSLAEQVCRWALPCRAGHASLVFVPRWPREPCVCAELATRALCLCRGGHASAITRRSAQPDWHSAASESRGVPPSEVGTD